MVMKQIFKLSLLFIFMWIGVKSLMDFIKNEGSTISLFVDILLFIIFIGSPAMSYWGNLLDAIFDHQDETEEKNNDEIN